jgi:DNA-binding MarR family transcriptional regulator
MAGPTSTKESSRRRERAGGDPPPGWLPLLRAHARLTRRLDEELRRDHGLSLNEYEVLLQLWLADEGRMRRVDLAEHLLITQGGVTRLLAGLERQGLVSRAASPSDARVVFACLTEQGAGRLEAARRDHLATVREVFAAPFSDADLTRLEELLSRIEA